MLALQQASGVAPAARGPPPHHPIPRGSSRLARLRAGAVPSTAVASDLLSWMASRGVDLEGLGVEVGGAGLVAARPLGRGDAAASVPEALWITKAVAMQSPLGHHVAELEPWVAVALFLLHERSVAGAASPWAPYIASLPAALDTPLAWTDAELEELRGTQLLASVGAYRTYFQQRYADLDARVFAAARDAFPAEVFTWEAFLWAACTVRARSHAPLDGDDLALVPLADLVGHARGGGAVAAWTLKSAGLFGRGRVLAVETQVVLTPGQSLAMDYGPGRTEGQVLLDHGVADAGAAAGGSFALTIALPEDDRFFDDKIDILESAGLGQANEFVLRAGGGAPEALLPTLRLVNLQGADAFLLESIFRGEVWEHMQQPVSEENEAAVCQSIVDGCAAVLGGYPTAAEEDAAALRGAAPGSRAAAALAVRLGEKEALAAAAALFQARLDGLQGLEYYAERRLKRLGLLDKEGKPTDWDSFFEDGIA